MTDYTPEQMAPEKMAIETSKILLNTNSILFRPEEPFILKSGRASPVYIDMRRMISFPKERATMMGFAQKVLEPVKAEFDVLAGGETAGIPYAAFLAERMDMPMIYVRKAAKGHGRMAQIEGHVEEGSKCILIEDLQTDGGSKKIFVEGMRNAGLEVSHAFVIFHYGIFPQSLQNMKDMGITLHEVTNWAMTMKAAEELGSFDDATLNSVKAFLNDPESWSRANGGQEDAA